MTERVELPEDSARLADFADFSAAYMTVEREPDGTIYLVRWWFGTPSIVLVVKPDGIAQKVDDA